MEPVVRVGTHVPFGYKQDPDDQDILLPIPEELELFEKAKKFLKQYSYREVAAWLSTQSERYISHVGLYKRVKLSNNVRTKLQLNVTSPKGTKKRYKKQKSSKPKDLVTEKS